MCDVVRRLEKICEAVHEKKQRKTSSKDLRRILDDKQIYGTATNPWTSGTAVATALETFCSRLKDPETQSKLKELSHETAKLLGAQAVDPGVGVYNMVRLHRFLKSNKMDVEDSKTAVVLNSNARGEFKLDAKRKLIVDQDLSFNALPRFAEFVRYQPMNPLLGETKDGRTFGYMSWGSRTNFDGLVKAFSVQDYVDTILFTQELYRLLEDARSAVKGRECGHASLYDCSGASIVQIMSKMERELVATSLYVLCTTFSV